jgi:hypothetical protein
LGVADTGFASDLRASCSSKIHSPRSARREILCVRIYIETSLFETQRHAANAAKEIDGFRSLLRCHSAALKKSQ